MKHYVIRIDGGLGNQMSQYAFYKKMMKHYNGRDVSFKVDYSTYKKTSIHNGFELFDIFNINETKAPQATKLELIKARNSLLGGKIYYQNYESGYPEQLQLYSIDDHNDYYFHGTWHSYDYREIMDELKKDFMFVKPLSEKNRKVLAEIREKEAVSIHVRRGDYVKEGLDILSKDYYRKAVDIVSERISAENRKFYIFSDDKQFVSDYFGFIPADELEIVEGNTGENAYVDMQLMSECKHNIIANSTFSYWAAMLNDNPDKIVIKPFMQTKERESWNNEGWIRLN